ncbi:MAG: dTDP-4-amino-4,6-dideoxygalactose transaminase [Bacteroidales bacterium]|jgi:dTDP-4-amino-4,6-dideoxygalactose transaminase|nr:dTDP-4-amino-4,6-dideoxygalactose transaminase [Bacteroidales bacterium]MDN5330749.1 dTDP-4-amino-4,6-dideoxygalactose transaminase [Bacteroidales bacterium]
MRKVKIPFNKPYVGPGEVMGVLRAALGGSLAGNGKYTRLCQQYFETKFGFRKTLLTTSCTDALEMSALLAGISPGDEVIMPSYTFVSTANAFVLRGAKVVFADTLPHLPLLDPVDVEKRITPRTRAIVVVHYCGMACPMDEFIDLARRRQLLLIEDAAHAYDSYYNGKPLGSLGHLATFSFHETKNIISGEGGLLVINDPELMSKAEIIWEKGTNRAAFQRGETDKYTWVEAGSSFLPSDIIAAFLYAQLKKADFIQRKRKQIWYSYYQYLQPLHEQGLINLPQVPSYATVNGNFFYFTLKDATKRDGLLRDLQAKGIHAVFHYLPLHQSPFYLKHNPAVTLPNTERFAASIVRLPFFVGLKEKEIKWICHTVTQLLSE